MSAFIGGDMNFSWDLLIYFIDELFTINETEEDPDCADCSNTLSAISEVPCCFWFVDCFDFYNSWFLNVVIDYYFGFVDAYLDLETGCPKPSMSSIDFSNPAFGLAPVVVSVDLIICFDMVYLGLSWDWDVWLELSF